MKFVTIAMLCEHTGRHRSTVFRALKAAGIRAQSVPGCKGLRLPERDANKFLLRQWPEVGALPVNSQQ